MQVMQDMGIHGRRQVTPQEVWQAAQAVAPSPPSESPSLAAKALFWVAEACGMEPEWRSIAALYACGLG